MSFIHSIKFKFTLWYLLVLAIILALLCSGVYFLLSQTLYRSLDESIEKNALELSRNPNVYQDVSVGDTKQPPRDLVMLAFYSGDQLVKITGRNQTGLDDDSVIQAISNNKGFFNARIADGENFRCFANRLPPEIENTIPRNPPRGSDKKPAVLIMGRPTDPIEESLSALIGVFVIAIPVCLVIAGGSGIFLARRVLKPVDIISQTAREIEEKDLSRRINVGTKDELGRLASTLNQMIERLEGAFNRQKQFTSDASHELRTPLALIQAEATLALQKEREASEYRQSLENISQDVDRMGKIVDQLLLLARSDAGKEQLLLDRVDLGCLLEEVKSDINVLCQEKGLALVLNSAENVVIRGDEEKLRRLFLNILDNDIRYTPGGGSITMDVSVSGAMAKVVIGDTGIGISDEDLPHIFDRFYRADKSRSRSEGGSGLGLAICKTIATAHGGEISAESRPGKGTTFTIKLPLNGIKS